ncbi:hypothetical protein AArcMg_0073 [Natrarchaeobaculum sulfurireducens]|uniref:Uncharacterized protein n=1 Tax=Natrarchaeobaculum sulfurireducens TaxID=2044521 RepID=A0A346PKR1_9EURY|nr:hypothetical protein AArcMg_0073 [Natrarchaeobaculum sulfurireducens]
MSTIGKCAVGRWSKRGVQASLERAPQVTTDGLVRRKRSVFSERVLSLERTREWPVWGAVAPIETGERKRDS